MPFDAVSSAPDPPGWRVIAWLPHAVDPYRPARSLCTSALYQSRAHVVDLADRWADAFTRASVAVPRLRAVVVEVVRCD